MKLRKPYKKILYWIGAIFCLLIILNFGINHWIKSTLPSIIEEKNDTPYDFKFKHLEFSIINNSISIDEITITPKINNKQPLKLNFEAKIAEIKISGVNFYKLISKKDISAPSIKIDQPQINFYKSNIKNTTNHKKHQLKNSINIDRFEINNAQIQLFEQNKTKLITTISDLNFEIDGVNFSEETQHKNIPFTYENFTIDGGEISHQLNEFQNLTSNNLKSSKDEFSLSNLKITSTRNATKAHINLLPEITAPQISLQNLDWGFDKKDEFHFKAKQLNFNSIQVVILKNSTEKHKDSIKPLLPFQLEIEEINVSNSKIKLHNSTDFDNINLKIKKINNQKNNQINIDLIEINKPTIVSHSFDKKTNSTKNPTQFNEQIEIKSIKINEANYTLNATKNKQHKLKVNNINTSLSNVKINAETSLNKIPFVYDTLVVKANSLNSNSDPFYTYNTGNISYNNGNLNVSNFSMKPKLTRDKFVKQLKTERDLYTITAAKINGKIDLGFQGNDFYFKSNKINVNQVYANIYRNKIPPDDNKIKKLYSQILRDLKFILEIQELDIVNSTLDYEEETEKSDKAGKLTFTNFTANIQNINSGFKKTKLPDTNINITCNFMNDSKLKAFWSFNPLNRQDKFNINGSINNFSTERMSPFTRPYLHASVSGLMQEIRFNFNGNNIDAKGTFGLKYENLKVTVYNPKTGKERKTINALGNLLLKSNTKDEFKEVDIKKVERNQDRSFFNFFWLCIEQGLKQTILAI